MRDSIWLRTLNDADRGILETSDDLPESADIVVIGAGLIGLSTAYYLTQLGVGQVCVIDRGDLLGEASGACAGGLWFAHQAPSAGAAAPLVSESTALYDELEDRFAFDRTYGGVLEVIEKGNDLAAARERQAAIQAAGYEADLLKPEELRDLEPLLSGALAGGLYLPEDGQLHPAKLAAGWIGAIREAGGSVCAGAQALSVGPPVETPQGSIAAQCAVIACGAWTPQVTEALQWSPPIEPVRGTLLALPENPAGTLRTTVMGPSYYWWQLAGGPIAGGGSEEHVAFDRSPNEAIARDIRNDLTARVPSLAEQPTTCAWSGFRPYCADLLPVLGPVPGRDDAFVSAGHFRMGVMTAPASGLALAQLIVDGETDIDLEPLAPERFALSAA